MPLNSSRSLWWLVPVVSAALLLSACSSSHSSSTSSGKKSAGDAVSRTVPTEQAGRTQSAAPVSIAVEPDDQGRTLLDAIGRATTSVDITVYEIDAPQINQALVDAIGRGVDVRLVVNGQWWGKAPALGFAYDMASVLQAAADKPGAGSAEVHWASTNFQITHQKTVLIDALAKDGTALAAGDLPPTAQAVVLTGNLEAYGYASYKPASSCEQPCNFWSARDFYMSVTDTAMVAEIARVFASDFACDGPTRTNDLATTSFPLTWSNGSTGTGSGDPAGQYPADGQYPYPWTNVPVNPQPDGPDPGPGTDQGNVRQRSLAVINGATATLDVYNEEMGDAQTVNAIAAAATRLGPGKVRVVMTGAVNGGNSYAAAYNQLLGAGAVIKLFPNTADVLYIHAKSIVADGKDAYVGSTNISSPSINFNRELGLLFTDQPEVLDPIIRTFQTDFTNPVAVTWTTQAPTSTAPDQGSTAPEGSGADVGRLQGSGFTPPQACGPVTLPTPWPPATTTTTTTTTPAG